MKGNGMTVTGHAVFLPGKIEKPRKASAFQGFCVLKWCTYLLEFSAGRLYHPISCNIVDIVRYLVAVIEYRLIKFISSRKMLHQICTKFAPYIMT